MIDKMCKLSEQIIINLKCVLINISIYLIFNIFILYKGVFKIQPPLIGDSLNSPSDEGVG